MMAIGLLPNETFAQTSVPLDVYQYSVYGTDKYGIYLSEYTYKGQKAAGAAEYNTGATDRNFKSVVYVSKLSQVLPQLPAYTKVTAYYDAKITAYKKATDGEEYIYGHGCRTPGEG